MPVPHPTRIGDQWGTTSFVEGFTPSTIYRQNLATEVRRNPEAVILRLMNRGAWDLAETLWEEYIDTPPK